MSKISEMKPTIVIGFGGTGIKTLLKLKKLVWERQPEILEQNKLICLGLDTEKWQSAKHRDKATGVELANRREYIPLAVNVDIDDWVKRQYTEWLDTKSDVGIAPHWPVVDSRCYNPAMGGKITNGAAQNRPVGRACVFHSATALIERLKQIMQDFYDITQAGSMTERDPTVHFIGSIAGGTGSSMVFDVPYITRIICDKMGLNCRTYGHFPMANAFLNIFGPWERGRCRANTWTVLKELDEWNRRFIHDPAAPHWKVNYTKDCGTFQDGVATDVAKQRPLDFTFLYHNINTEGHLIRNAEPLYEIIAQAIGYPIISGLTAQMRSNQPPTLYQITDLNSNDKVKAYSALGVATLDLPVDGLKKYMGHKWAGQLALDKCAADVHASEEEYEEKKWGEFGGLLAKVFTLQFPVYRKADNNRWEEGDVVTLKDQWGELAEVYGLEKFDLRVDSKVATKMLDNYDGKLNRAKNYRRDCESAETVHEKRLEIKAQEKLDEIKGGILQFMTSVMIGARSTDALLFATPLIVRAIEKVDQILADVQEHIQGNEARLSTASIVDVRLQDKPFFNSARERQVKGWVRDNDQYWINKSETDRVVTLRSNLKEIREFLGKTRLLVHEADKTVELFATDCESNAELEIQAAVSEEVAKVTCEYLVKPNEYADFIKQFNYKDNSESIFKAVNRKVEKDLKITLAEALCSETKSIRKRATDIWFEECQDSAASELAKYKLGDHIAGVTKNEGNDDRLREQLKNLVERAGPWMEHNDTKVGGNPKDQLTVYQYLIYPKGADSIKKTFVEMEKEGEFGTVVKSGNKETECIEASFGQSIVRLSMVHCYSLEVLDFLTAERGADLEMRQDETRYASGTLRTIFKDNVMQPYLDPLAPRVKGSEVILNFNNYNTYLTWFMLGHLWGVLEREYDTHQTKWIWKIKHNKEALDGGSEEQTVTLPPEDKLLRMNQPERGSLTSKDFRLFEDIWANSHERDDAAVKLGCLICETKSFHESVANAQTEMWKGPEEYRQMLLNYDKNDLENLDPNDQKFIRTIITKQVEDLAI